MVAFKFNTKKLFEVGPQVEVSFRVPIWIDDQSKLDRKPFVKPVRAVATIDTGAKVTVFSKGLLKPLGLISSGKMKGFNSSGVADDYDAYLVRVELEDPDGNRFSEHKTIYESTGKLADGDVLLGRDILSYGSLKYDGKTGDIELILVQP